LRDALPSNKSCDRHSVHPYPCNRQLKSCGRCRQRDNVLPPVSVEPTHVPTLHCYGAFVRRDDCGSGYLGKKLGRSRSNSELVGAAGRPMTDRPYCPPAPARLRTCPVCHYGYVGATCGHCGRTGAGTANVRNTRLKIVNSVIRFRRAAR
jgi:hypothetical protein